MCVIAVKNHGISLPKDDEIDAMWNTNPDGAGIMYLHNGKVYIEKGFMKLTDLKRALASLNERLDTKNTPMVLHFRITTHGGTSPHNTHPFPISNNTEHLKALDLTCSVGMVHNGIISSMDTTDKTMSDTMVYIQDILSPLSMLNKTFYKNDFGKTLMENQIGWSKLAFLDKSGTISLVGDFKKDDKTGMLYSNLNHTFKSSVKTISKTRDTTELLKPIPVGTYLSTPHTSTISGAQSTQGFVEVKYPNIFFVDEYDIIYTKIGAGKMRESSIYVDMYDLDQNGSFIKLVYADINTKETEYVVEDNYDYMFNKGEYPYDY
jgi:predicted glutamine amidotransferase